MKILLTADPSIPVPPIGYGGIERIVDGLARYYTDLGHTVGLVAHPQSTCNVASRFSWTGDTGRWSGFSNSMTLRRVVGIFQPDVLHSFSRLGYMLPVLRKALPKVMSYQRHTGGMNIGLASRIGGISLQYTGCSEFICNMGRASGGRWRAIPNFVELENITFVADLPKDAPLLFLSRIESIKGPDMAIDIAKASGRRLLLAGNRPQNGPELNFWATHIEGQLGRNGIEWVGEVNNAQKNDLLGRAAALVVPIQWDEPFGIVFAEALAAGTPVITCKRGAAPEIVEHGKTGFFIDGAVSGTFAVRRLGLIDRAACRHAAETRFSRDGCAGQYLSLYKEMLANVDP